VPDLLYDNNHPDWTAGRGEGAIDNLPFTVVTAYTAGLLTGAVGVIIAWND
jgi:hypothetical protein